ncbi:hypothetical protein SAMN05444358_102283 [Ruegeria halocynthiae]|uniref:(S)-ureidoglycine aminohydrolase cupin domain-containing protein n=1 Tax=Ruegeria halocynthiae TaxID=985054 RepID=A0A1H2YHG8_9RHOB|nr:cupin domain-containing protein [Ruegeria halocynthiae]SDX04520.1 hypothetical protein SAMN05444358_102283 [Ruegeria halocynthiae]
MINLTSIGNLDNVEIGAFEPKLTTVTPGQLEARASVWSSNDGGTKIGVWECTPGEFTADRLAMAEHCHILSGRVTVRDEDGSNETTLEAGSLLMLPKGWKGTWVVHEHVRKTYVLVE